MNWTEVEGKWNQMKGTVREKFGKLTDDDLQVIGGKKDQFLGKLQRYGIPASRPRRNWTTGCRASTKPKHRAPAIRWSARSTKRSASAVAGSVAQCATDGDLPSRDRHGAHL
jgi:uncharacterized protein YjbJ (UPF0337 family)